MQGTALRAGREDREHPPWVGQRAARLQLYQRSLGWQKAAKMVLVALKSLGSF